VEITIENSKSLQAVMYPTKGEGFNYLEFYVVRYISYTDPNGEVSLKGRGDWKPYDIGPVELEDTYWVNIGIEFIEVFEKAKMDGKVLYLEDVTPYAIVNEI
jgi:hypothetical protein